MSLIEVTCQNGWAQLQINRPDKRNAMDRASRQALLAAFDAVRGDARAVILTGTGGSFCAGMDLKERAEDIAQGVTSAPDEWIAVNLAIRAHPAIFIAAVNGLALGGGATLIGVCDLAIASTTASIGCPEMGFATYPGMAGPAIQLSGLTRKQAAWLILTTNRIDGATAERWGLVNTCVPPEHLLQEAAGLAERLAAFDGAALAESKAALDHIPAEVMNWKQAMAHGQAVNRAIRARTIAPDQQRVRFVAGARTPGQGT